MGNGDDKSSRATVELDREVLARLTRDTRPGLADGTSPPPSVAAAEPGTDADPFAARSAAAASAEPPPITARTSTVHDPLTMALLAEVARSSRTIEIDLDDIEAATVVDRPEPHPHTRRRG
ncbi:MAG: hypothetical protein M3680_33630 [Myxococcota bacterium]|nr:hypothetical protein [Myxococcota bacterium]